MFYSNQGDNSKRYKVRRSYLPKGIIKNYKVIINVNNCYDQPFDSDIKRLEELSKLKTGQGGDYTTGCSLGYDYIKRHHRLVTVDLSRQRKVMLIRKQFRKYNFWGN